VAFAELGNVHQSMGIQVRPTFRDRRHAGQVLASAILARSNVGSSPVVLALPRGGVPVGFEIAAGLSAPLDVCVVRSVEIPDSGAVLSLAGAGDRVILSAHKKGEHASTISEHTFTRIVRKESREIARRERAYRGLHSAICVAGRTVMLVDDGLAAPEAFIAAVAAVRARDASRVIVAVPVATSSSYHRLLASVDDFVCLEIPSPFHGIGASYMDFSEVSDLDVRQLHEAARNHAPRRISRLRI
jgi:predicted phosphoribosyltransferase